MIERFNKEYDLSDWGNETIKSAILDEIVNAITLRSPNRIRVKIEKLHAKKVTAIDEQVEQDTGKIEEAGEVDKGTE